MQKTKSNKKVGVGAAKEEEGEEKTCFSSAINSDVISKQLHCEYPLFQ